MEKASETLRTTDRVAAVPPKVDVACPLCGADRYVVRFPDRFEGRPLDPDVHYTSTSNAYGQHGRIVKCRSCSLVYMNPRPHQQSVQDNYAAVEDTRYVEEEQGRVETFTESLEHLSRFVPSGRLLDVGCHIGTFLEVAESAFGYEVSGVEPSRWAAAIARERINGSVHCGPIEDAPIVEGGYDVVTLWDVIEHLPDPAIDIRAIFGALRPGGIFAVSTMDVESWFARIMGRRWPWYMQMHLVYFSRATLSEMLRREGFVIDDVVLHTRRVRVSYLISRLDAYAPFISKPLAALARRLKVADRTIGVKLGDIFTVIARKP